MEIILIFLTPILFLSALITATVKSISDKSEGRRTKVFFKYFILIIGIPFLIFFWDEMIGQACLHVMCKLNGGYTSTEPLTSDGYYDIDTGTRGCNKQCINALVIHKIPYYENTSRPYNPKYPNELYKYYLAESPINDPNIRLISLFNIDPNLRALMGNKYIIYEKTDNLSSKYEISLRKTKHSLNWPKITKTVSYIKNRNTNKVVASSTRYRFHGGWFRHFQISPGGSSSCPTYSESHAILREKMFTNEGRK